MSCIHFKFKCDKKFDSVVFDGASCTLAELKKLIIQKKGLSKHAMDFDLLINNAQTKQVYSKPTDVIQRNSSVIVARIPAGGTQSPIDSSVEEEKPLTLSKLLEETAPEELARIERNNGRIPANRVAPNNDFWIKKACEQQTKSSNSCAPEEDELNALSTLHLRESNAMNSGRRNHFLNNAVPHPSYVCHRCHRTGHFKHVCPLLLESDQPNQSQNNQPVVKRATGIPRSELIPLKTHFPGAYITSEGTYAIPRKDAEAIINADKRGPNWDSPVESNFRSACTDDRQNSGRESTPPPPAELTCSLCKDLFIDAVMTPCCHENFCDSCIRNRLLESDENECPACHQKDIPLDQIFANKFLRDTVAMYGRKKTCTVTELFDKKEPDLDQALTTACLPRSAAGQRIDQLKHTTDALSRNDIHNDFLVPNRVTRLCEASEKNLTTASTVSGYGGNNATIYVDSISDTLAASQFGVHPVSCPAAYDHGATIAAMAAAAAALFIPAAATTPFDSMGTLSAGSLADVVSSTAAAMNQQPSAAQCNGMMMSSQGNMLAALTRAGQLNVARNDYFGDAASAGLSNGVLSREQFELLKETVTKLKSVSERSKTCGEPIKEDACKKRSRSRSPCNSARQDDQPARVPVACCGDRLRKVEHHRSSHHREQGSSYRHCSNSRVRECSPTRQGLKRPPTSGKREGRTNGEQNNNNSGAKSCEPKQPKNVLLTNGDCKSHVSKSCSSNHDRFTLNVLEFSENCCPTHHPNKIRKTSSITDCEDVKSISLRNRSSSQGRKKNEDQQFVLKPRLLSHVQSVKESSSMPNEDQSTTGRWIEKSSKVKKSKHKHGKKKDKKRKHHRSDTKHKHGKKHSKKSSSCKKQSIVPVAV